MINDLLSRLPGFKQDFIYDLIAYQDLKLCLDVGAAAGALTRRIKQAGTDETRIIGFEPFVGNHSYFLKNTQSFKNVELVKKAAAATTTNSTFRVPSTVQGSEEGWENYLGYSSTGYLVKEKASEDMKGRNPKMQELSVETVAIDDLVDEHVDFMKIDVQGGEYGVLKGCERVITTYGIDVMYVEFDGDRRIVEYLNSLGYTIFDTDYLLSVPGISSSLLEEIGFYDFQILKLSTGRQAYRAKLSLSDENYCDFYQNFKDQKIGYAFTDLVCVSQPFLKAFLENVLHYANAQQANSEKGADSFAATQRPIERRLIVPPSETLTPTILPKTTPQAQPTIEATPIASSNTASTDNTDNIDRTESKQSSQKKQKSGKPASSKTTTSIHPQPAPVPDPDLGSTYRATSLIRRIAAYYSRWPLGLAIAAIALNLFTFLDVPFHAGFTILSTATLLFLIGHAASKADRMQEEIESIKEQQLQLKTKISKRRNRGKARSKKAML